MTAKQILRKMSSKRNKQLDIGVYQLSDGSPTQVRQWISTGLRKLDMTISNKKQGGIPVGKLTTIIGEQGSGKTLLALLRAKQVISKGGLVVWIDTQNRLDLPFRQSFGIPRDKLLYIQLNTVQAMFQIMQTIAKQVRTQRGDNQQLLLFVVDSIAGLSTKAEVQGAVGDANYGQAAKLLSQGLRKHIITFGKLRARLLFTNQLRFKINTAMFQDPLSATYGGKAVPYYSSLILKLRKAAKIKIGDTAADKQIIGNQISVTVEKNRMAPPFRKTRFQCIYDRGISQMNEILDDLKGMQVVKAGGGGYSWTAGPARDQRFAKKDFPSLVKDKDIGQFVWDTLASKYVIDIDRVIDADMLSGRSDIVEQAVQK